jgi:CubicO group peptidase (beta-lactamase class C family)
MCLSKLSARCVALAMFSMTMTLASASLAQGQSAGLQPAGEERFLSIKSLLDAEYAKDGRGGLAFGLLENGELTWTYCVGLAEEKSKRLASVDDIYPIASATKMLTGLMLLQLTERGKVHLSDPVMKYVPEVERMGHSFPWSPPITLIQLATMTAGIQPGFSIPEHLRSVVKGAPTWEQKIALIIPSLVYQYEPGTANRYSNSGYAILGLALSRAAQRPYSDYVTAEILRPLGMTDSAFVVPPEQESRLVYGYRLNSSDATPKRAYNSPNDLLLPAAGLLTTVGDLAKLMRFQMDGGVPGVLSDAALTASYRLPVPSDADLRYGNGVGFASVRDAESKLTAVGHGGTFTDGFTASYEFDRSTRTGVILLANTYGGQANYKVLVRKILALLNPQSSGGSGQPPLEEH